MKSSVNKACCIEHCVSLKVRRAFFELWFAFSQQFDMYKEKSFESWTR